jgi:hypothetical protein
MHDRVAKGQMPPDAADLPDDKRARMLQLQDELMAASNSDPASREAWANLSRIINNR